MFTKEMMNKLMDYLKEDQSIYDQPNSYIKSDLERAKRWGCTKAQAEEATRVLQYSVQNIIDDIWGEDTEEEEDDSDNILNFDIRQITEKENSTNMKNVINKTKDTCNKMIASTVNKTCDIKIGFFAEVAVTLVAYFSVLCYGYKLSFGWLGKIFRKEMKISEYLKKALPASIIFGCIGWCIGRNAGNLLEQYYRNQENDIQ